MESSDSDLSPSEASEGDDEVKESSSSGTTLASSTEDDVKIRNDRIPEQKKATPIANKTRPSSVGLPKALLPSSSLNHTPVMNSLPILPPKPVQSLQSTSDKVPTSASVSPSTSFSGFRGSESRLSKSDLRSSSEQIHLPPKKTKKRKNLRKSKSSESAYKEPSDEEKDKKGKLGFRLRRRPASEVLSDTDRKILEKQLKMQEEQDLSVQLKKENEDLKKEHQYLQNDLQSAEKKIEEINKETEEKEQHLKTLEKEIEFLRKQNESFTFLSKTDDVKYILAKILTKLDIMETTMKTDKQDISDELSQQKKKLNRLEAELSEKVKTGSKEREEKERNKMSKERICKHCKLKFTNSNNMDDSCMFHPGRWKKFRKHWTCCRQGKKSLGCTTGRHSSN